MPGDYEPWSGFVAAARPGKASKDLDYIRLPVGYGCRCQRCPAPLTASILQFPLLLCLPLLVSPLVAAGFAHLAVSKEDRDVGRHGDKRAQCG